MNIITKTSALNLAIFSVLALNGAISALAVPPAVVLSPPTYSYKMTVLSSPLVRPPLVLKTTRPARLPLAILVS